MSSGKFAALLVLAVLLVMGASALVVAWGFKHDMRAAQERCAALGAEPEYTYQTRYICITPDGRVVG